MYQRWSMSRLYQESRRASATAFGVYACKQQPSNTPLHDSSAQPRDNDGGKDQAVANGCHEEREQHSDVHRGSASQRYRRGLVERVPPVHAELDDREVDDAEEGQDCPGTVPAL